MADAVGPRTPEAAAPASAPPGGRAARASAAPPPPPHGRARPSRRAPARAARVARARSGTASHAPGASAAARMEELSPSGGWGEAAGAADRRCSWGKKIPKCRARGGGEENKWRKPPRRLFPRGLASAPEAGVRVPVRTFKRALTWRRNPREDGGGFRRRRGPERPKPREANAPHKSCQGTRATRAAAVRGVGGGGNAGSAIRA